LKKTIAIIKKTCYNWIYPKYRTYSKKRYTQDKAVKIMARVKKESPMRLAIIQAATELFFENGFSKTTAAAVCAKAKVGTGNLTSYFPTKEHILDVLVHMMIDYQWQAMENATDEGKSSLLAYCLELTTMAAISEDSAVMHDFYIATYSHPMTLDNIRVNDVEKIKKVFGEYCTDWSDERFYEAECIVSGIEYATLMTTEHSTPLPVRIEGALSAIMLLFGVPEDIRKKKIQKVLAMDYRAVGKKLLEDFKEYVNQKNMRAIDNMLASYNLKR
jgi:AcrR family transcriptional regulator